MPNFKKDRSKFTMKGWSPFTKTNVDKKNKQKMFSKKASDLQQAWRSIKDPNSNRAKQLKKEAKTIGLTLEQQMPGWDKNHKKYSDLARFDDDRG